MTRIMTDDIVKAGYCITGARRHFPQLGLSREDFKRFVREGVLVSEVEHIEDLLVRNVIAAAKRRETANG